MAAFRDDRQALLERLRALEEELVRSGPHRDRVRAEIDELRRRVSEATAALEEDRRSLDEIARALERLVPDVDAPARATPAPVTAAPQPSWPRTGLIIGALGCLLFLFILVAVCARQRQPPPPDPALELAGKLPGFPHRIDPVALLPAVREAADTTRPLQLISIKVRHAGSLGMVDLDGPGYQGSVEYRFQEEAPPDPPPVGPQPPLGPAVRRAPSGRAGLHHHQVHEPGP